MNIPSAHLAKRVALLAALASACGEPMATPDSGTVAMGPAPAAFPILTPCPSGWREVADESGVVVCDPWPQTGYRGDCAPDEAHFPGATGCMRIGTPCPSDGWPAGLPTDRTIVYVDDAAAVGGDGSAPDRAFSTITAALAAAPTGAVVAIATGTYDENITITRDVALLGACVALTRISPSVPVTDGNAIAVMTGTVEIRNLSIADARAWGVYLPEPANVTVADVAFRGVDGPNIAAGPGVVLELSNVVVRDTPSRGLIVLSGARGHARRLVVERTSDLAILVAESGSDLFLEDVVAVETSPLAGGDAGRGMQVVDGAHARVERGVFLRNAATGVWIDGTAALPSSLELRDVVVSDTMGVGGEFGLGLDAYNAANVIVERALFERNGQSAIHAAGSGGDLQLRDVVARETRWEEATGAWGRGMEVTVYARASGERLLFARNPEAGVVVGRNASVTLTDLTIVDGLGLPGSTSGMGIWAQSMAMLTVNRARIERCRSLGIGAIDGAAIQLSDTIVRGIERANCADTTCADLAAGFGLSAHFDGSVTATRFEVRGAAVCGVVVGTGAASSMDLAEGVIDEAPVGACVQADGYDTSRLRQDVEYRNVGVPLQSTTYELPASILELDSI